MNNQGKSMKDPRSNRGVFDGTQVGITWIRNCIFSRTRVRCNMLTSNQHVKYSSRKTSCAYGCTGWVVKGSEGGEHLQTSTIFKIGRRAGHLCGVTEVLDGKIHEEEDRILKVCNVHA